MVPPTRAAVPLMWRAHGGIRSRAGEMHAVRQDHSDQRARSGRGGCRDMTGSPPSPQPSAARGEGVGARPGRLQRLRQSMAAAEGDAVLVSQPESRRYLSGYRATDLPPRDSAGYLLITED